MANFTPSPTQTRPLATAVTRDWTALAVSAIGYLQVLTTDNAGTNANATAASGEKGQIGLIVAGAYNNINGTISANEKVTVVVLGPVYVGEIALVAGTLLYVATTDGLLTDTKPTNAHPVAVAQSTNTIYFFPVPDKNYT